MYGNISTLLPSYLQTNELTIVVLNEKRKNAALENKPLTIQRF